MGCYYHEGVEDVAICPQCGKKLCRGCASVTVEGICYNCAIQNNLKVKNTFFIDLALSIILCAAYIVGIIFIESFGIFLIIGVGFIPSWRALTWIANGIFGVRVYDGAMWFGMLLAKIFLSAILSAFVPLIYFVKLILNIGKFRNVSKNIKCIEENFNSI